MTPIDEFISDVRTCFQRYAVEKHYDQVQINATLRRVKHARDLRIINFQTWDPFGKGWPINMDAECVAFDYLGVEVFSCYVGPYGGKEPKGELALFNEVVMKLADLGILLDDTPFTKTISPVRRKAIQKKLEAA
jgi:hypothetical protein